jgi:hypothetical protein
MPSSAAIVRRWLTDQSLRQFLDVLDDSALQHQWKFRRAFWEAVYRRGLIGEAWVVFDKVSAKLIFKGETPFARWEGGGSKQIQNGPACLLLRIGSGIVAEWSHNGRCYIWHDINDPSALRPTKCWSASMTRRTRNSDVRLLYISTQNSTHGKRRSQMHS